MADPSRATATRVKRPGARESCVGSEGSGYASTAVLLGSAGTSRRPRVSSSALQARLRSPRALRRRGRGSPEDECPRPRLAEARRPPPHVRVALGSPFDPPLSTGTIDWDTSPPGGTKDASSTSLGLAPIGGDLGGSVGTVHSPVGPGERALARARDRGHGLWRRVVHTRSISDAAMGAAPFCGEPPLSEGVS